ncbi:MAG: aldo/keto reductase family protein [Gemmatimonadota bacterium]
MRYRHLGQSGLKVSTVGLGSWLTYGGTVEEDAARACIARAYALGVTFFDTANVYARGEAEIVMGRALAAYPRDSFVLATKVYFPMGDGPCDRGLSRKHVFEQCHHSLRRLGVEYIDLYQCHRYDDETPLDETCEIMNDLIRQGKVLYWGVSEWEADEITAAVELCRDAGWSAPVSNQPEYNALQRSIEAEILPACVELGLGSVVWSPLAQGVLTGKYRTADQVPAGSRAAGPHAGFMGRYLDQDVLDAAQAAARVAAEAGQPLARLALAWGLRHPEISSVIAGAMTVRHVEENVAAAELRVDEAVFEALDRALASVSVEPV